MHDAIKRALYKITNISPVLFCFCFLFSFGFSAYTAFHYLVVQCTLDWNFVNSCDASFQRIDTTQTNPYTKSRMNDTHKMIHITYIYILLCCGSATNVCILIFEFINRRRMIIAIGENLFRSQLLIKSLLSVHLVVTNLMASLIVLNFSIYYLYMSTCS